MEKKEQTIQWHPAFFAGIQIELGDEAKYFSFEAEHQLGTKPMAIRFKKKTDPGENWAIRSNVIGRNPTDYLNVEIYRVACES